MFDGIPQLDDVLDAQRVIAPHLPATPLRRYPLLDELVGTRCSSSTRTINRPGAFKVRGGVNLVAQLSPWAHPTGVAAASTGNHGQSVAYAARLFGVAATIFVPRGANPGKVASMRAMGAEVVEHGVDFDEAREQCARVRRRARCPYSTRATSRC